jgi:hypothetical protein
MKTLDTDFMAVVRLVRAFIDPMRVSGWECIVLIAPADAVQPYMDELRYCAPAHSYHIPDSLDESQRDPGAPRV